MSKKNEYTVSDYEDIINDFNGFLRAGDLEGALVHATSYAESNCDTHYRGLRRSILYLLTTALNKSGVVVDLFTFDQRKKTSKSETNLDDHLAENGWLEEAEKAAKESARQYQESKKHDFGKLRWDLLPLEAPEAIVKVLTYGAEKYGADTWQDLPNGKDRYFAALMRHLVAWRRGEAHDAESGLPHIDHVLCNAAFLKHISDSDK